MIRGHSSITSSKRWVVGKMMMFDDKVGRWEWLKDDVIKKYTREKIL